MCSTCGCGSTESGITYTLKTNEHLHHEHAHGDNTHSHEHHTHDHSHDHTHPHTHEHGSSHSGKTIVALEQDILSKNNMLAHRNRGYFDAKNILCVNLVSSPGSGKTSILERTLSELKQHATFYVIEGDQQTTNDTDRIRATGVSALQINTGKGCHLDAHMILHALQQLKPVDNSVVFIENVGNLVCPAMFDLGEKERVVIMSVTEGDDKPIKYPDMFYSANLCIINKIDLLPYVKFDVQKAKEYALKVNPKLSFIELSTYTGEGFHEWYGWLNEKK